MNSNRRLARFSRADVLWALALFLASQIGLAIAIECWLPELRDPQYVCRASQLVRRATGAPHRPLSVVMLGSSRVDEGFISSDLESRFRQQLGCPIVVYNFGIPGSGPVANLLHFERLIAAGVKPDLLLIEVVPSLLSGRDGQLLEATHFTAERLWRSELDLLESYGVPAGKLRRDWWQDWPAPCHAHRYAIASRILPQMFPIWLRRNGDRKVDGSGWRPHNDRPLSADDRRRKLELAWRDFGVALQTFQLCDAACRAQRDLLIRCREEQIAAALIWMPEGKAFQSWYPPAAETKIRRHLEQLSEQFGAPLIDARDWVEDEGFKDGHHLQDAGAARFTERLGREVLEPILLVDRHRWSEYLASLRQVHRQATIAARPAAGANSRLR